MECTHCNREITDEIRCTVHPDGDHCNDCHKDEASEDSESSEDMA